MVACAKADTDRARLAAANANVRITCLMAVLLSMPRAGVDARGLSRSLSAGRGSGHQLADERGGAVVHVGAAAVEAAVAELAERGVERREAAAILDVQRGAVAGEELHHLV